MRVGNAPCSWGTLEFEGMAGEKLTCQRMLDELAATGYTGTELGDWGFMPTEPSALKAELARRALTLLGAFVPVALRDRNAHGPGEERVLKTARLLADTHRAMGAETAPFLVLADENGTVPQRTQNAGRIRPEHGLSAAAWEVFGAGANRIAAAVKKETGLRTVFHHHCAGFVETPAEIASFLSCTDPSLVGLVFDTGHLVFGDPGHDPDIVPRTLDRHADRIWYMHFKDCERTVAARSGTEGWDYFASVRNGVFCELGRGCVDFRTVLEWLRRRGYGGWVLVEQDVLPGMGTPRESAQRNRDYLRTLGL
ncbi:MAG: TIM barrel protein [Verrucomicrobiales bacterium]|nr:TIM barrel protein [Verrucomicrobiales bacterium]